MSGGAPRPPGGGGPTGPDRSGTAAAHSADAGSPAAQGGRPRGYDEQVANRIARVFKHRRKWAKRTGVACFRVYDKDIPDQPFVCDWYDGEAVVWTLTRTRNETDEQQRAWVAAVRAAVAAGLGIGDGAIHLKERRRQRDRQEGDGQYHRLEERGAVRLVEEQGLRFEVNLHDYLDTGLFLDHRLTRARVRDEARGRRVLNLFAYTGSFTCYAAAGGARATRTVDLSNTYLAWAQRNLEHNGLAGAQHVIEKADCLRWLEGSTGGEFDLIVCDPPTFSNSTAMDRSWSVERDQDWLLGRLHDRLAPGGTAYFSTNCHGFRLSDNLPPFATVEEITSKTLPEDFTGRTPHRCWRLSRR